MKVFYSLIFIAVFPVFAADHEAGLKHLSRRFFDGVATLPSNQPIVLSLDFYTVERQQAHACAQRLSGKKIELGAPLLKYNFKVTVTYQFADGTEVNEQWLREQYYLGVAYYCDWSGAWRSSESDYRQD